MKPNISSVARFLAFVTGLINQELLLKNGVLSVGLRNEGEPTYFSEE